MIQSVERAFQILEILDAADRRRERLGAQAIADAAGLKFPTAHSFLRSLVELGYADQDPGSRKYGLGVNAKVLGGDTPPKQLLIEAAVPVVERLASALDETVLVVMRHPLGRIVVFQKESSQELKASATVGVPLADLYGYATGRILLSLMPEREVRAYWDKHGPAGSAWPDVKSLDQLIAALAVVRGQGVLTQANAEAVGIAAPLSVPSRGIRAALGCALPVSRVTPKRLRELEKAVAAAAAEILDVLNADVVA